MSTFLLKRVYLECTTENHNKFYRMSIREHSGSWSGSTTGYTLETSWGRIGSAGQHKVDEFNSLPSSEFNRILSEKTAKGYHITVDTAGEPAEPAAQWQAKLPWRGSVDGLPSSRVICLTQVVDGPSSGDNRCEIHIACVPDSDGKLYNLWVFWAGGSKKPTQTCMNARRSLAEINERAEALLAIRLSGGFDLELDTGPAVAGIYLVPADGLGLTTPGYKKVGIDLAAVKAQMSKDLMVYGNAFVDLAGKSVDPSKIKISAKAGGMVKALEGAMHSFDSFSKVATEINKAMGIPKGQLPGMPPGPLKATGFTPPAAPPSTGPRRRILQIKDET